MLSLVLATLHRPDAAAAVVAEAIPQLPDEAEVVVVDQSDDEPFERLAAALAAHGDPRVRHLRERQRGLPNARNVGVARSRGDTLLFLDDDVRLLPGCLQAHLAALEDPAVGGVVGRILERTVRPNSSKLANYLDGGGRVRTRLDGLEAGEVATLKGANMSFRRAVFEQVGGFDRRYAGTAFLEDADLSTRARRAGWRLRYEPQAALHHLSVPAGGVRQRDRVITEQWRFHNTGYYMHRHRGHRSLPRFLTTFSGIALKRAWEWRDPPAYARLMGALREGWALANLPPDTGF